MITLYHSPQSRSTRIIGLLMAMGVLDRVNVRIVSIPRQDGSGGRDPVNPHPEGKVPLLVHDGVEIWESTAIMLYLTDLFPASEFGVRADDPQRGRFLAWLSWYGAVVEPVVIFSHMGLEDPVLQATFRGMPEIVARLRTALAEGPWLMGERLTAADLLLASPFLWFPEATPQDSLIRDWVDRVANLPWQGALMEYEASHMAPA